MYFNLLEVNMIKKTCMVLMLLLAVMTVGYAQSSQTGTLMGVVSMDDGSTIPGVTVIVTSPALMVGKMTTVTNENGVYRFGNLPPGVYELNFQLESFRPFIRKDIRVVSLQTYTVNASLTQEALKEAVVVMGQSPTVDTQRQTRASNFDVQFLKSLPAPRNLLSFVNMAPGMIDGGAGGGSSSMGSSAMDNSFNLDGVNLGDPATGLTNVSFGLDIMDEISIQAGGLSAEFGSVRGAMVNVVTKSGGNRISGTASFYMNHEDLIGDNTKGTPLEDQGVTANHLQFEPSFSLGGPVIKDKLWFFASGTYTETQSFVSGFPYTNPDANTIVKVVQPLPYIKLTFQADPKNKFVLSYNYSDRINNNRFANIFHTEKNTSKQSGPTHVINANWNRYFGENIYANFKVGISKAELNFDSNTDAPCYYDVYTYRYLDRGGNWRTYDRNQRNRYNFNVDATTFIDDFMGTHELKIGGEAQLARVGWQVYGNPDPVSGCHLNYMLGDTDTYLAGFVLIGDGFDRKDNMDDYFGFIQDTWRLNRHLTLNLGLRLEYNSVTWPVQGEAGDIHFPGALSDLVVNRGITESIKGFSWTTLAPRVGFIYDLFGDNKTLAKASWSRYTVPNQIGWINGAHPNGWVVYITDLNPNGTPIIGSEQPLWLPATTNIGYGDYKLKAAYTDELTFGLERELFTDWSASARFIRKWDRNLIHQVDAAQLDMDKLMSTGELDWSKNWIAKTTVDPFDGKTVTFYSKINTSASDVRIVDPAGRRARFPGIGTHPEQALQPWLAAEYLLCVWQKRRPHQPGARRRFPGHIRPVYRPQRPHQCLRHSGSRQPPPVQGAGPVGRSPGHQPQRLLPLPERRHLDAHDPVAVSGSTRHAEPQWCVRQCRGTGIAPPARYRAARPAPGKGLQDLQRHPERLRRLLQSHQSGNCDVGLDRFQQPESLPIRGDADHQRSAHVPAGSPHRVEVSERLYLFLFVRGHCGAPFFLLQENSECRRGAAACSREGTIAPKRGSIA